MPTQWEELETYLTQHQLIGQEFNSYDVAHTLRVVPYRATCLIQAYLVAQRAPKSRTLYVLHRQGRTRSSMWRVGARTRDVRELTRQCMDDITVKVMDALTPDLRRMGALNPRLAQTTEAMVQVFLANVNLLATQVP